MYGSLLKKEVKYLAKMKKTGLADIKSVTSTYLNMFSNWKQIKYKLFVHDNNNTDDKFKSTTSNSSHSLI